MAEIGKSYVVEGLHYIVRTGVEYTKEIYQLIFDPAFYRVDPEKNIIDNMRMPLGRLGVGIIILFGLWVTEPSLEHGYTLNPFHVLSAIGIGLTASYISDLTLTGISVLGVKNSNK